MSRSISRSLWHNFLGHSPEWYKKTIIFFLVVNIILAQVNTFVAGWVLIIQFIFTLAMALKCYPLQPGGLIAIQAVILGLTSSHTVYHEIENNFKVILLLMFMVAGIYFMKDLLLYVFTKLLINVKSKIKLSVLFSFVAAVLSAFLDALTVTAVLISVSVGFYSVYHQYASNAGTVNHDHTSDNDVAELHREDLDKFRSFLRSLIMHGAVGTALGGVATLVGEPQNLIIAEKAGWSFVEFYIHMAPVSIPALVIGLITCVALEKSKICGYGEKLPEAVRDILVNFDKKESTKRNMQDKTKLVIQGVVAIILALSLAFHVAEVGIVGLMIIVLLTSFNGIIDEHQIGHAFEEALPFTALLVVFFTIIAVIHEQHLFQPITTFVLSLDTSIQAGMFFAANGVLSMISDNVFVATVYIDEVKSALDNGSITREHFESLAVAINAGTNLPSVATPNGQAAFLFLLTSAIAPLIRLSYGKMVLMALPYTIVLALVGITSVMLFY